MGASSHRAEELRLKRKLTPPARDIAGTGKRTQGAQTPALLQI